MTHTKRTINVLLTAAVALATLASTGNAAQSCCCPDHEQTTPCAMSCGSSESPDALQAAMPGVTKLTVMREAAPSSVATRLALHPAEILERFTTPSGESPPKRYLRNRVLRL